MRVFGSKIGLSVHEKRAHPDDYNRRVAALMEGKTGHWSEEETAVMARIEAGLPSGCFVNQELMKVIPNRTLEGIKGKRRQADYKALVENLRLEQASQISLGEISLDNEERLEGACGGPSYESIDIHESWSEDQNVSSEESSRMRIWAPEEVRVSAQIEANIDFAVSDINAHLHQICCGRSVRMIRGLRNSRRYQTVLSQVRQERQNNEDLMKLAS